MSQTPDPVPPPPPVSYPSAGLPPGEAAGYVVTDNDRTMAMLIHLGLIFAAVLSLILWLIYREKSPFIEHHGKQALAFFVASAIVGIVVVVLCFFCVGFILLPVFLVLHLIFPIMAGVAANRGEWYVYPMVGRMIR